MAHQPVGDSQTITTSATSAMVQFAVQSDTVRVVPTGQNVHVAIGTTAVATTSDYFVPSGTPATLNLGRASSMGIADITKGASTVITLSEGMGNPFKVDDVLTISGVTGFESDDSSALEASSLSAFRKTFDKASPGDLASIFYSLRNYHPFYNGEIHPKIDDLSCIAKSLVGDVYL